MVSCAFIWEFQEAWGWPVILNNAWAEWVLLLLRKIHFSVYSSVHNAQLIILYGLIILTLNCLLSGSCWGGGGGERKWMVITMIIFKFNDILQSKLLKMKAIKRFLLMLQTNDFILTLPIQATRKGFFGRFLILSLLLTWRLLSRPWRHLSNTHSLEYIIINIAHSVSHLIGQIAG